MKIPQDTENNKLGIADLLEELAGVEGLYRIRVSSLEPGDISEELLDVFCAHPNIMPHIHLSVQSGSDNILRRMGRQYGSSELREKISLIKSRVDRPAITSDIIVGFPGETDEDFQATVELARWAGFSKMHVFGFSLREGTPAVRLKDRVPSKVIKERAEILRKLSDELGRRFREQFVGETCEVLLENTEPLSGKCERYFEVEIKSVTTDCTDYTDSLATEIIIHPASSLRDYAGAGRGHREHREIIEKQILNNLVSSGLSGKGEIVKVRITGNVEDGATGEAGA